MLQTPKPELPSSTKATPHPRTVKKIDRILQNDHTNVRMDDGFAALSAGKFLEHHYYRHLPYTLYKLGKCCISNSISLKELSYQLIEAHILCFYVL